MRVVSIVVFRHESDLSEEMLRLVAALFKDVDVEIVLAAFKVFVKQSDLSEDMLQLVAAQCCDNSIGGLIYRLIKQRSTVVVIDLGDERLMLGSHALLCTQSSYFQQRLKSAWGNRVVQACELLNQTHRIRNLDADFCFVLDKIKKLEDNTDNTKTPEDRIDHTNKLKLQVLIINTDDFTPSVMEFILNFVQATDVEWSLVQSPFEARLKCLCTTLQAASLYGVSRLQHQLQLQIISEVQNIGTPLNLITYVEENKPLDSTILAQWCEEKLSNGDSSNPTQP